MVIWKFLLRTCTRHLSFLFTRPLLLFIRIFLLRNLLGLDHHDSNASKSIPRVRFFFFPVSTGFLFSIILSCPVKEQVSIFPTKIKINCAA